MPTLLREIYLSFLFLVGTGAVLSPVFGNALPIFNYQTAKGSVVEMPVSVAVYAVFLVIAVAALAKRFLNRSPESEGSNAQ